MRVALPWLAIVACGAPAAAPTVALPHNHTTGPSEPVTPPPPELAELARILTPDLGPTIDAAKVAELEATLGPVITPWNPERAALELYHQRGRSVHLAGIARDEEDVAQLVRRLAVSSVFDDVRVLGTVRRANNLVGFEINLTSVNADPTGRELVTTSWPGLAHDPFHAIDTSPPPAAASPLATTPLDQLKLLGIVTGDKPVAMFQQRDGTGVIVHVGDRIGTVWVVSQITDHELVLVNNGPSGRIEKRLSP